MGCMRLGVVASGVAGAPDVAYAAPAGGAPEERSVAMILLLVLCIAIAYLGAHLLVDRLQRRLLVLSGVEYLLLGVLLGPAVPQIRAFDALTPVLPAVAVTAGWVGLLRGTEVNLRHPGELPPGTVRVALVHHLVSGAVVGVAAWLLLVKVVPLAIPDDLAAVTAGVAGCCAAADSAGPMALLSRRYAIEGSLGQMLERAAQLGDVLVIFALGILVSTFHRDVPGAALSLRATEWAVLSVGLGITLGLLFTAFLLGDESANGRFLALVGIITFGAGAAWWLRLDPLVVNLSLGVVVANTASAGRRVRQTLKSTERPMALVLLVLAGALWQPPRGLAPELVGVAIAGFIALRLVGKIIGSALAAWGTPLRADLFRGMLGQGEVTVAMAVSFRLIYTGPVVDLVYTAVLASVVVYDLVAPRVLRALLLDAGALQLEPDTVE